MRLVNFMPHGSAAAPKLGAVLDSAVLEIGLAWPWFLREHGDLHSAPPEDIPALLISPQFAWEDVRRVVDWFAREGLLPGQGIPGSFLIDRGQVDLKAPIPHPASLRDFYAFEQHVSTARSIRGQEVPEEWYRFPVFYFSNTGAIYGPEEQVPSPTYTQELDFELEIACILGKSARDVPPDEAGRLIAGYTILNDWSARDIQRLETRVGLGPAKAKDFATSLGPFLVTPDELAGRQTGRPGVFDLRMTASINGDRVSTGNMQEIHFSFYEMISRASQEVWLRPGDVIGSGTVGGGCLLEITLGKGPWLQPGDRVDLEIERLGILSNRIMSRVLDR